MLSSHKRNLVNMCCASLLGGIMILSAPVDVSADTTEKQADIQKLEKIDQKITNNIGNNPMTKQAVLTAVESLSDKDKGEITKIYHDTINSEDLDNNQTYQVNNLGSGFTVVSSESDVGEGEELESPLLRSSFNGNVTKKYGKRQYIMTHGLNVHGYGIDSDRLSMHYTLGKSGIKMRYSSTAGTYSLIGNVTCSAKTTDKVATKVGANVNAFGKYHAVYTEPISGLQMSNQTEIHGAVKIKSWNKAKKTMKLYESHYVE